MQTKPTFRSWAAGRETIATDIANVVEDAGFECLDISSTFFNTFDHAPFKYMRRVPSAIGLYRPWCRLLDAFGRRSPGIAFGYSFMIALAQRP